MKHQLGLVLARSGRKTTAGYEATDFTVLLNDLVAINTPKGGRVFRRIRPEWWWGVFWLPHFWLIAALGVGVFLSGWRDVRRMRRREREAELFHVKH